MNSLATGGGSVSTNRSLNEMTLTELQEIAMRQQQQIEINQQLLMAKEKRLKQLKQEEVKNQQQFNLLAAASAPSGQQQQQQLQHQQPPQQNNLKLEALKQNVLSQELKIFKLKQLRSQILEYKLSNSNMYSELDLIKNLFEQKERELYNAIGKVNELSKQIEQLRKLKQNGTVNSTNKISNLVVNGANNQQTGENGNNNNNTGTQSTSNFSELDRLKQELQIRNKLNEQQAKKIIQQQEMFGKKQIEVLSLDKRIEELKERIASKRNNCLNILIEREQHVKYGGMGPLSAQLGSISMSDFQAQQQLQQQQQQQQQMQQQQQQQQQLQSQQQVQNQQQQNQSPSKLVAKFATKQEIANTYMNKYNSEAYQKYQMRMLQQNSQPIDAKPQPLQHPTVEEAGDSCSSAGGSGVGVGSSSSSNPSLPSSSSSLVSLSPISNASTTNHHHHHQQQHQHQQQTTAQHIDSSTLPSHLKLEFDKIKYLPDVVKTIKKRHSISEIESSNTLPPQIFQKIIEKHHKNFLDQSMNNTNNDSQHQQQSMNQQTPPSTTLLQQTPIKLNKIVEAQEPETQLTTNVKPQVKLTTFMPKERVENVQQQQQQQQPQQPADGEPMVGGESTPSRAEVQKTKSIIKPQSDASTSSNPNRRVNFDPHALLLDAAVEGELDLVIKCAKQVKDISEPNDEGITALHNSVCAGHFGIVKFLVEYGCDINYADNDGWTPLHCAASCNNLQMIQFLIENGASVFATTLSDNETAIRKCEEDEAGYQMCYDYLLNAQNQLGNASFNQGYVYALYSYEAQNDDELTFVCHDRLLVVDKNENEENGDANDGWWTCSLTTNNKQGLVPKNYLGLYPRVRSSSNTLTGTGSTSATSSNPNKNQEESTIC